MTEQAGLSQTPGLPRPADHPHQLCWPPKWRQYPSNHEARSLGAKSAAAFNEQWAREDFGVTFIDDLKGRHPDFTGDWWFLAILDRVLLGAAGTEKTAEWPHRIKWWNAHYGQFRQHDLVPRLDRANLDQARLPSAKLSHVSLNHASLIGARLAQADLASAQAHNAICHGADLTGANLRLADLQGADLRHTVLDGANLTAARLRRCQLNRARIACVQVEAADLRGTNGLFGKNRATARHPIDEYQSQNAFYYWSLNLRKRERESAVRDYLSWEVLSFIGRLRLFGVSYLAFAIITAYVLLARWYNTDLLSMAEAAASIATQPTVMSQLLSTLPPLPTPTHLGCQLAATALLALAATLYQLLCPSEVKEANEVRWTRAMRQPLWEYRSASWSRPIARYVCAALFSFGAGYSLYYLGHRGLEAIVYLLLNAGK